MNRTWRTRAEEALWCETCDMYFAPTSTRTDHERGGPHRSRVAEDLADRDQQERPARELQEAPA